MSVRSWNLDAQGNGEIVLWLTATDSIATRIIVRILGNLQQETIYSIIHLCSSNNNGDVGYGWIRE